MIVGDHGGQHGAVPDGPGDRLGGGQEPPDRRPLPALRARGLPGGALQGAEHGPERVGSGRRRDRPRPGGASGGRGRRAERGHEPDPPQARVGSPLPGRRARASRRERRLAGLPRDAGGTLWDRGGEPRATATDRRARADRGRGEPGGDQPARPRLHQYARGPARRCAGPARRRRRPGRGLRGARGDTRAARPRRPRARGRPDREQAPGRGRDPRPGARRARPAYRRGRAVLGVCGGFQMLGEPLRDPERVESEREAAAGLGLLPVTTTFAREKTTTRVRAHATRSGPFARAAGSEIAAYEIHAGRSALTRPAPHPFTVVERGGTSASDPDGAVSPRGNVVGTYLHGLFANGLLRRSLLGFLTERRGRPADPGWGAPGADRYERLADIVGRALDMPAIAKLAGLPFPRA